MKEIIKGDWQELLKDEFEKDYYKELKLKLDEEYKTKEIFPVEEELFSAFNLTQYKDVKVLILGQDPYHNNDQAHGLAFSVKEGIKIPPSLRNIYKELNSDLGIEIPNTGYLINWAKEGIMLLNTTLTVRAHTPMSHSKIGWEIFTDRVIELIDEKDEPVVFILWGNHAKSKKKLIKNEKHLIIESVHPSPLSASRGFFGTKPFSKTNEFLRKNGLQAPSWRV